MTATDPLNPVDNKESVIKDRIDQQTRDNLGHSLPGSMASRVRHVVWNKCVKYSPTRRFSAAATTDCVMLYSVKESFIFEKTELSIDVTREKAIEAHKQERGMLLSLRINTVPFKLLI